MGGTISVGFIAKPLLIPAVVNDDTMTKEKEDQSLRDIPHMKAVMENSPLQKEFCKYMRIKKKDSYLVLYRDLEAMKLQTYYPVVHEDKIPTRDIILPPCPTTSYDDFEAQSILRQALLHLQKVIQSAQTIPFSLWCETVGEAQDILLVDVQEEFHIFTQSSSYQQAVVHMINHNLETNRNYVDIPLAESSDTRGTLDTTTEPMYLAPSLSDHDITSSSISTSTLIPTLSPVQ